MAQTKNRDNWKSTFEQVSREVSSWREQHPRASFSEIEHEVDRQLAKVRVNMIQELALESELRNIRQLPTAKRPACPSCGKPLVSNGRQKRRLVTSYEQEVELERSKGYCRHCRVSFFPPG